MPLTDDKALELLDVVRDHLRLPDAGGVITPAERDDIVLFLQAAWHYIETFTNATWDDGLTAPASVRIAALMLVADMYENREAQSSVPLHENKTVERLLWPYRVF